MSEIRTTTRVKEIAMSYQSYLRSISNPAPSSNSQQTPSPGPSIHRKPAANYSPMPSTPSSTYRSVTQPVTRTPSLSTSLAAPTTASTQGPSTPTSINSQPASNVALAAPLSAQSSTGSLTQVEVDQALRACLNLLIDAVTYHEKRPFSALLLGPDKSTVIQTHNSISHFQHAESELARLAAIQYSPSYLANCTLVSTWEPCAMCSGTVYWSGIGQVLYAASETKLKELTGPNNQENMTMDLPCRAVFSAGQRQVEVIGPILLWEEKVLQESGKWWKTHNANNVTGVKGGVGSSSGSIKSGVVVVQPEETILSSIGEDGEYQADLKIDWMN